jgi:hypothetical protein
MKLSVSRFSSQVMQELQFCSVKLIAIQTIYLFYPDPVTIITTRLRGLQCNCERSYFNSRWIYSPDATKMPEFTGTGN